MKKTAIIFIFILLLTMCANVSAQNADNGLPQVIDEIPDPSEVLGTLGSLYQADFAYNGGVYDAYLFPRPENSAPFIEAYTREANRAGYEAVADLVEGYDIVRIYDAGSENLSALLFYNYQGYMMLMVPKEMRFTLKTELSEPLTADQLVERGNQAIAAGDYQSAIRYLLKAAGDYQRTGAAGGTVQPAPTAIPTEAPMITRQPGVSQIYTVKEGDSCWSIAAQFGMDVQDFMSANNLDQCNIQPGDDVVIPGEEEQTPTPTPMPGERRTYVVEAGDTCWAIAVEKFGVNFELFMSVNGLTECNINVGDEVIIPGTNDQMPTMTPIPLDQYTTGQQIQYPVEMNDSYNGIAAKFNTTLVSIQQLNPTVNVYSGFPQYGQILTIAVNIVTPTPSPTP